MTIDNKVLSFIDIHFTSFRPTLQPEFTIFCSSFFFFDLGIHSIVVNKEKVTMYTYYRILISFEIIYLWEKRLP